MDLKQLIDGKIGKRMAALAWSGWLIKECAEPRQQTIIAALAIVYMICQTISDYLMPEKKI